MKRTPDGNSGTPGFPRSAGRGSFGRWKPEPYLYAIVVGALIVFPFVAGSYQAKLLSRYLVFGLFAMSFDLLWGYVGIMNFGHAVFFGLGAYSVGLVMKYVTIPGASALAVAAALLVPMLFALVVGYFLFYGRVAGVYFAIVTMALSILMQSLAIAADFTGGLDGLRGFPPLKLAIPGALQLEMKGDWAPYYTVVSVLLLVFVAARKIVTSSFGRALEALRENPDRLESLGYDIATVKLIVFVLACGMAGVSGALYVPIGHVSPEILGLLFSTNALVWVSIGGRGTLIGGIIGALLVSYLQYFLGARLQNLWYLVIGVFFVLVVLFRSEGLMGFLRHRDTGSPGARQRVLASEQDLKPGCESESDKEPAT
jgi:urea transport system permease protein